MEVSLFKNNIIPYGIAPWKISIIEDYTDIIWTERFRRPGDVRLVVPMTETNVSNIVPGRFLGINKSNEIMVIESVLLQNKQIKVYGRSILSFFENHLIRVTNDHNQKTWDWVGVYETTPDTVMEYIVRFCCIDGYSDDGIQHNSNQITPYSAHVLDHSLEIDNQVSGLPNVGISVPYGDVASALNAISDIYNIGMAMPIVRRVDEESGSITMQPILLLYLGRDLRALGQKVQFSEQMDTLTDITELRSDSSYKNLCYAYAPGNPNAGTSPPGIAVSDLNPQYDPSGFPLGYPNGFDRRAMMIFCEDLTDETLTGASLTSALNDRAAKALAEHRRTEIVEGQIIPNSQFIYNVHYGLGDIVELLGTTGIVSRARVTEYIRTKDANGEREYPTVSVIE